MNRYRGYLQLAVIALMGVAGPSFGQLVGEQTLRSDKSIARGLAFSPDGRTLAAGSDDGTIRLWEVLTGKERATLRRHVGWVACVAFSPNGRTLASGGQDGLVRLWGSVDKRPGILKWGQGAVYALVFSPDGKTLAVGGTCRTVGRKSRPPERLRLWDVEAWKVRLALTGYNSKVWTVAFSPDGRTLVSGHSDGRLLLWEVVSGKLRSSLKASPAAVFSVAFIEEGRMLASASYDVVVALWDLSDGRIRASLPGHETCVSCVVSAKNGKILASGDCGAVRIWETVSGKRLLNIKQDNRIMSMAFTPDGRTLAIGDSAGVVKLWDVEKLLVERTAR